MRGKLGMNVFEHKLEAALQNCNQLLDEEAAALEAKDLDELEKVEQEKKEAVLELSRLLDDPNNHPLEDASLQETTQLVLERIRANSNILSKWMDQQEQEINLLSRKKHNLKGVKKKYVTEQRGYLRRSNSFKA